MQANNLIKGTDTQKDEEKTELAQYVIEFKQSLFSVFYLILKNAEASSMQFTIILLVEYL